MKIKSSLIFIIIIIILNKLYKNKNFKIKNNKINNLIRWGRYNTTIANCVSCHTINGGKPFAGGVAIKTPFGIINTPNITFDKLNGLGDIKFKQFIKIIKYGISKNYNFLYPAFPYINYHNIKKIDIKSIYIYLKSIPKEDIKNKSNFLKSPFKFRKLLLGWRIMFLKFNKIKIKNKLTNSIKRGKYIIETLGHCNMCHSKINILGSLIKKFNYTGNIINYENCSALINNQKNKKSIKELSNLLKTGINKKKIIIGNMSEVINNSLQYISKIDIKAMSSYIKILFNKYNLLNKSKNLKINKNISKIIFQKGGLIYKNYCLNCHGSLGLGKTINYPSINKNIININFINNIINLLKTPNKTITLKISYKNMMSNFILLNIKNINKLINYIYFLKYLNKN